MADFDLRNPSVTHELVEVARFWLNDIGVDGFRLDAIKHLIENGEIEENTPESREWLGVYESHLESIEPNSMTVGEIYNGPSFIVARYVEERAIDIGFDFKLAGEMVSAAQRGSKRNIARAHRNAMRDYPLNQFSTFLTNHDQDRLANRLLFDIGRIKAAAALLLTGPGVPFLYYGEEIGMAGSKPDERIRTPMQWENADMAGFTEGRYLWQPLQDAENLKYANVADQTEDPESLLSAYRRLIHLRNENFALRRGALKDVESDRPGVYAFLRHDSRQVLLVVINLDDEPTLGYALSLKASELNLGEAHLVFETGVLNSPTINDQGGFDANAPTPSLAPHSLKVIAL